MITRFRSRRMLVPTLLVAALCLSALGATAGSADAQSSSSLQLLTGSLADSSGRAIPRGLTIHASNADGSNSTTVDDDGDFEMWVPAGQVDVTFSKDQREAWTPDPLIPWWVGNASASPVEWTESEGPLELQLPTAVPLTVKVVSGGEPVEGASVRTDEGGLGYGTQNTQEFVLREATDSTPELRSTMQFNPINRWGQMTTDADGEITMWVFPTDGTIRVDASMTVNGVDLRSHVSGVDYDAGTATIVMPDPPQLLTGSVKDTSGRPIPRAMNLVGSNADGSNSTTVDNDGNFSMWVPAGDVEISYDRNQREVWTPDPMTPWWLRQASPPVIWSSDQGPLELQLPTAVPLTVHVTSGGEPVTGATLTTATDGARLSTAFTIREATDTTSEQDATIEFNSLNPNGSMNTDSNGNGTIWVFPTAQKIRVDASMTVNGVTLRASAAGLDFDAGTATIVMPDPPQLLTGSVKDTSGRPIPRAMNLVASNADGSNSTTVDNDGNFSMWVPAGDVDVVFDRNQREVWSPDPMTPWWFWEGSTTRVVWSSDEGPLELQLPTAVPLVVHVTSGGEPVADATITTDEGGRGYGTQRSSEFVLREATDTTPEVRSTIDFNPLNRWGSIRTDDNGDAVMWVFPTDGGTIRLDANATFRGANLVGRMTGVPADGEPHSVAFTIPGNLTYENEHTAAPYITSLEVTPTGSSEPVAMSPVFALGTTVYSVGPVAHDVTAVDVAAVASTSDAEVLVHGNTDLSVGVNLVTVQAVDPASGSARTYTLRITRSAAPPTTTTVAPTTSTTVPSTTTAPTTTAPTTTAPTTTPSTSIPPTTAPPTTAPSERNVPGGQPPTIEQIMALPEASELLVDPSVFRHLDRVEVSQTGFVPGEPVQLVVASTPQVLAEGTVDASGRAVLQGRIPPDLALGAHTLAIWAPERPTGVRQGITVIETAAASPTPGSDTGRSRTSSGAAPSRLAMTGSGLGVLALGLLLLAAGVVVLGSAAARRRR